MATETTITVPQASQYFPVGTTVGLYVERILNSGKPTPIGPALQTSTVTTAGSLSFAGVNVTQPVYWAGALIGGNWQFVAVATDIPKKQEGEEFGGSGLLVYTTPSKATARPAHPGPILWRCPEAPEHLGEGDLWLDTSSEVE